MRYKTTGLVAAVSAVFTLCVPTHSTDFAAPFYMCPDAKGAEQTASFELIDLSQYSTRIETMPEVTLDGIAVTVEKSSPTMAEGQDPIIGAFEQLFDAVDKAGGNLPGRLAAVCFTEAPSQEGGTDLPFLFMPAFLADGQRALDDVDRITVPSQTYHVLRYEGPPEGVGDMRFTLTERFWPEQAPELGLVRADAPNLMIYDEGLRGNEAVTKLEMWTPIEAK